MHILRANFHGTPNVGLYGYATKDHLLLGESLPDKLLEQVVEALGGVEVHPLRIAGTGMPGLFLAGNRNAILVPSIAFEAELAKLKKLGLPCTVLRTNHTCLGNNIACNDHGAIISTEFSEQEREAIEAALQVPTIRMDIAGLHTPGSFIVLNGKRGIIHRDATPQEVRAVEETLKVKLQPATANLGTPYLHAAILNNGHGLVVGDASGGPEIVHIDQALGYIGDDDE